MKRNSCSSRHKLIVRNEFEGSGPNRDVEQKHSTPSDGQRAQSRLTDSLWTRTTIFGGARGGRRPILCWRRQSENPAADWSLSERRTNRRTVRLCRRQIYPGRKVAMFCYSTKTNSTNKAC